MALIPYIPTSAPFTPAQRAWLNGYLAGLFADANVGEGSVGAAPVPAMNQGPGQPAEPLLVLYGSQTGTAEQLARRFVKDAASRGFAPDVLEMNAYARVDLKKHSRLVLITSTWGDGDPPDNATAFWQHLNSDAAPQLSHLQFSVLALGDRNYSDFCGAGKKFDERLETLGAKRIHPRGECDVDYEAAAAAWMEGLWPLLRPQPGGNGPLTRDDGDVPSAAVRAVNGLEAHGSAVASLRPLSSAPVSALPFNRTNPFPARLIANRNLSGPGSAKETRHFEISLEGGGLAYEVGDALGVMPMNCSALVGEIIQALGCDGEEAVKDSVGNETSLRHALLTGFAIRQVPPSLLSHLAERSGDATLLKLLDASRQAERDAYFYGREIIDLLLGFPEVKFTPPEFIGLLNKLQPRLYSISSSPKTHPGEVHLTVAAVRYQSHGRGRKGVCSTFLADRVELGGTPLPVFVQVSHGFRLPTDGDRPVIMIGPGTGIAPFRAFLQERRALGAKGKNWLFFGDQRADQDFLYREEMETMFSMGHLSRLDTAFSRDQPEKIYVQQRMLESAAEVYQWLEDGAHLYVCGDARRMARDVDLALHQIIEQAGGKSADQAAEYVRDLKTNKRYQRDVY